MEKKIIREIMEEARIEALKSVMSQKHGAIIFKGSRIIDRGHNYNFGNIIFHNKFSVHAEVSAILNAIRGKKDIRNCDLLVVRVSKSGMFVNSKPCKSCMNFINQNEIIKTYYSS